MTTPASQNVTQMLLAWGEGDEAACEVLIPVVYDQLRRIARKHLRRERAGDALQTTALIGLAAKVTAQRKCSPRSGGLNLARPFKGTNIVDAPGKERASVRGADVSIKPGASA